MKATPHQRSLVLPIAAFLAGLVALGVALFAVASGERGGAIGVIGGPFALTDQDGRRVTEKDFAGTPFLVFFGFTHCPDVCPTTLADMSQIYRVLGDAAPKLRTAFITVDPERDDPEALKSYLSSFDPHIVGLTGNQDEVDRVTRAYRAYARKVPLKGGDYTMDHTALIYLMNKRGEFVGSFNLKRPPEEAVNDLKRYL